jgi:hypothetical protein
VPLNLLREGRAIGRHGRLCLNANLLATHRVNALMNTSLMHCLGWRARSRSTICVLVRDRTGLL